MKQITANYDSIKLYAKELNDSVDTFEKNITSFKSKKVNYTNIPEINTQVNEYLNSINQDLNKLKTNLDNWITDVLLKSANSYESIDNSAKKIDYESTKSLPVISEAKISSILNSAKYSYKLEVDTSKYNEYCKKFSASKYALFRKALTKKFITIPNDPGFVPQGCCQAGSYYIMTAYDKKQEKQSRIYVIDGNGNVINVVNMDGKYHAGGVTYDSNSDTVYISAGNKKHKINAYSLSSLVNGKGTVTGKDITGFNSNLERHSVSYTTVDDGKIFVGEYGTDKKAYQLESYKLNSTGGIIESTKTTYKVPYDSTQGMAVYNYKGKKYYLFSCSNGKKASTLYVSKLSGNTFKTVKEIPIPPKVENVSITQDNNVLVNFESIAKTHIVSAKKISADATILNLSKIL